MQNAEDGERSVCSRALSRREIDRVNLPMLPPPSNLSRGTAPAGKLRVAGGGGFSGRGGDAGVERERGLLGSSGME